MLGRGWRTEDIGTRIGSANEGHNRPYQKMISSNPRQTTQVADQGMTENTRWET